MVKRTLLPLLLTVGAACAAMAQSSQPASNIPKIIPPSPAAAAIEKFGTVPVNYATGVPSIGYPMWNWQQGRLSLSLGLSYHAGGHKVDDMAPNSGLGWALNGLGRISRTVRGIFDDHPAKGFMYTPVLPQVTTYQYNGNDYIYASTFPSSQQAFSNTVAITPGNSPYSATVVQIADGALDGEQDVFSYNFGGGSGRFIIDKNKQVVPLEHTNSRITMSLNTSGNMPEGGTIEAFKITDDKGIEYHFTYKEIQSAVTVASPPAFPPVPPQHYISGWLLTKVKDPLTADSIMINYAATYPPAGYETGFSQSQSYWTGKADIGQGIVQWGIRPASDANSFMSVSYNEPSPTSIVLPDGATVGFAHNFNRADLINAKALTGVEVKDYRGETVKKFAFSYGYFSSGSGAYVPAWAGSGNDYNKRLRLDRAEELAVDGSGSKATVFTYNGTALNPRGSKNIDFWGGNVDPSRNNHDYVPIVPLDEQEMAMNRDFGAWLPGADRRPDETYMKAGILERVDYPTGGYNVFEYEANRAFSPIDYYVDSLFATPLNWAQAAFGQNQTIGLPGRTIDKVVFRFMAVEAGPRPAPDPNGGQTCFAESQDMQPVAFEINSTDGSFSQTVTGQYAQIVGSNGLRCAIALPLGKTYRVKFIYNIGATCAWQYPFTVSASAVYYTAPQDKLAGGLRIKKITSGDGLGGTLVKTYGYDRPDGHTSATLGSVPDYGYYRSTAILSDMGDFTYYNRYIHRNSNPTNTLSYYNGSPLLYTRVTETETDGSHTVREFDPIVSASNGGTGYYPYLPSQDFANLSGLQLRETAKDNTGTTKTEQQIGYTKYQTYLVNQPANRNVKTGVVANGAGNDKYYVADQYFMYTSHATADTMLATAYENGQAQSKTVISTYDPARYYLRSLTTTNAKGTRKAKQLQYVFDEPGAANSAMVSANMLNYVTGGNEYIVGQINGGLQQAKTNFALWQGNIPLPANVQKAVKGTALQTEMTFDAYDTKGNLLQYTGRDGVTSSIIFGYRGRYPVAKITGKSYADAVAQSGIDLTVLENPTDEARLMAELAKLRQLQDCLVTTYTYRPLVGISTETGTNGDTVYYLYDTFNRLKAVKDKDGNIVSKNSYQYKGN